MTDPLNDNRWTPLDHFYFLGLVIIGLLAVQVALLIVIAWRVW